MKKIHKPLFIVRATMIFTLIMSHFLMACSTSDITGVPDAYICKDTSVKLPSPDFDENLHCEQILTTTYQGEKKSVLVLLDIKKDSLTLTGLSTSYIKLFSVLYTKDSLEVDYSLPKAFLPPVNQVLLDIMLCHNHDLSSILDERFTVADTSSSRTIMAQDERIIYFIEYASIKEKRLPVRIENREFNYTISIKYL